MKLLSTVIATFAIISNYSSSMSLTIDILDKDKYKVSISQDSYNRDETFYSLEDFPEKLNTLTCGSIRVDSVYFEDEINNLIKFKGIKQNDDKIVKLIINSTDNLEPRIILDFANNIVNFHDISWHNNIRWFELESNLKFTLKFYDPITNRNKEFTKLCKNVAGFHCPHFIQNFSFVTSDEPLRYINAPRPTLGEAVEYIKAQHCNKNNYN